MKDIEQKNQMLSEENCSLISKIESKKEEKASLDTLVFIIFGKKNGLL